MSLHAAIDAAIPSPIPVVGGTAADQWAFESTRQMRDALVTSDAIVMLGFFGPLEVAAQVNGSFVYGLSALFLQEHTLKDGRIAEDNFHTYQSMRIAQMPKVETIIVQGGGDVWGGIGEPTICVAAPAVLNAIYKATGKRYRTLPLKNGKLRDA